MKNNRMLPLITALLVSTGHAQKLLPTDPVKGNANIKGEITVFANNDLKPYVTAFNKLYPNIKVTVQAIPITDMISKMNTSAAANTYIADVLQIDESAVAPLVAKFPNYLSDIGALASKYQKDFSRSRWLISKPAGKLIGLPSDNTSMLMFYRADLYKKAGIDPTSLTTWDKFIAAGKKVQAANPGVSMLTEDYFGVSQRNTLFTHLMQQQGASYFNTAGQINLNSSAATRSLTLIKRLKDEQVLLNIAGLEGLIGAVKGNKTATIMLPTWFGGVLKAIAPEMKGLWGVAQAPAFSANGSRSSESLGSTWAIPGNTKNLNAAWAYVE